jgi:hypothetical protein
MSVITFKGLAASRGVPLERVLRSALSGALRDIVKLPPRRGGDSAA